MDWLKLSQKLQAISQSGLAFSPDAYDRERYKELRQIAADIMENHSNISKDIAINHFEKETGYATPKVDVRAALFEDDKILLVQERSDEKWTLPGGWCDVGLSPTDNIIKEIKEESGLDAVVDRLIAVYDIHRHSHSPMCPFHHYKMFFICNRVGGQIKPNIETLGSEYFPLNNLPLLSTGRVTRGQIEMCFSHYYNSAAIIECD